MKHAFHLVGNVKVNATRTAYPNNCFVLGFQHHRGSQRPAAVMVRWRSFSRFRSSQLLMKSACYSAHLPSSGDAHTPSKLLERKKKDLRVEWEIIHSARQRILKWELLTLRSLVG